MNTHIKQFKSENYPLIKQWWDLAKEQAPQIDMIPETSYLMYLNDKPILSVSLFLTNSPLTWIDNYIGNPELKGSDRKTCGYILLNYLEQVSKAHGKDRMFCMSMNEKTSQRYIELGFIKTASNISTFLKGVK